MTTPTCGAVYPFALDETSGPVGAERYNVGGWHGSTLSIIRCDECARDVFAERFTALGLGTKKEALDLWNFSALVDSPALFLTDRKGWKESPKDLCRCHHDRSWHLEGGSGPCNADANNRHPIADNCPCSAFRLCSVKGG